MDTLAVIKVSKKSSEGLFIIRAAFAIQKITEQLRSIHQQTATISWLAKRLCGNHPLACQKFDNPQRHLLMAFDG